MGTSASQPVPVQLTGQRRKNKNRIIYDQLVTSGPGSLEKFCKILRNHHGKRQYFIAEQLEKGLFIDNVVAICYLWFFVASFSLYLLNYRSYWSTGYFSVSGLVYAGMCYLMVWLTIEQSFSKHMNVDDQSMEFIYVTGILTFSILFYYCFTVSSTEGLQ